MSSTINKTLVRLLRERAQTLVLVDVGARNGPRHLEDLAEDVEVYAFEPNPEEYKKLVEGNTDAAKLGLPQSPYKSVRYFPYALGNADGQADFHVTPGPGACGLLEPDLERLREIVWKGRRYERNFGDDIFAGARTISVETKRLDAFAREQGLPPIDLLKVDVEGSEYEVLEGAGDVLADTGVLFVEVCFIPFRKGQKLFSHVDVLLRQFGFDLLHYHVEQQQIGYKSLSNSLYHIPYGYADNFGQPLSGDAVYVNRDIRDPDRALKQAAILLQEGFVDEALFLLRTKCRLDAASAAELLNPAAHVRFADSMYARGFALAEAILKKASSIKQKVFR